MFFLSYWYLIDYFECSRHMMSFGTVLARLFFFHIHSKWFFCLLLLLWFFFFKIVNDRSKVQMAPAVRSPARPCVRRTARRQSVKWQLEVVGVRVCVGWSLQIDSLGSSCFGIIIHYHHHHYQLLIIVLKIRKKRYSSC